MVKRLVAGIASTALALTLATPAFAHGFASLDFRFGTKADGNHASIAANANVDATCVKPAVTAREAAIGAAWNTYAAAMTTAYANRKIALEAAWSNGDASVRAQAELNAWNTFKTAAKTAAKNFRNAKNAAWDTFRAAAKACNASVTTSMKGEVMDRD
jgi:hypothetical protein